MLLWEMHMSYSEIRSCYSGYVTLLLEISAVFIFCVEALHWKIKTFIWKVKISWNAFVTNAHVLLWNEKLLFEICYLLLEVSAVFSFCVEAWHWKIITFIWKGKYFMKCFCEKRTCVSLKWEEIVWNMSTYCKTLWQCSFSL